jgi:excisionase family DNA binding protein
MVLCAQTRPEEDREVLIMSTETESKELLNIPYLMKATEESESCWRKRLGRREIPFIRLGANVRIRRSDFEEWLRI